MTAAPSARHRDAIERTTQSAALTAQPAWRAAYAAEVSTHRRKVAARVASARGALERIASHRPNDEDEKAVKDEVKTIMEERIAHMAWRSRTVQLVAASGQEPKQIADMALRLARNEEREHTLVARGLADAVATIVGTCPTAEWD